ncbi:MAG TPA: hypothetical protein VMU85_15275 [Stellaceae bacterium]|nr:hypothetical protein [Stellaceae bacterium]
MRRLLNAALLACALAPTAAPAQPAAPGPSAPLAFTCPPKGTVVRFDTGAILTFGAADGFRCAYTDNYGRKGEKVAGFADDARLLDMGLARLWPLTIGGEQKFDAVLPFSSSSTGKVVTRERYSVLRRETVTVPAGTFNTVLVEWEEYSNTDGGIYDGHRLFWYAPELGIAVKSTVRIMTSYSGRVDHMTFVGSSPVVGDYQAIRITRPGS